MRYYTRKKGKENSKLTKVNCIKIKYKIIYK